MNGLKSWKTTLLGILAAVIVAVQPLIATGEIDWSRVGMATLIAAFTYFTKDADKTGTKELPR